MPDFITTAGSTPRNLAAGIPAGAALSRRGELINMPWHLQLQMEGRVFTVNSGITTTPVAVANATIDITLPQITVQVPAGTTAFLLEALVYMEITGGTINEMCLTASDNAPGNGTSTAATAANMKTRGPTSAANCRTLVTGTPTYTNPVEFWRSGEPARLDQTVAGFGQAGFQWHYLTNTGGGPFIGPASINLFYACGTSGSAFSKMMWAEFNTADLGL